MSSLPVVNKTLVTEPQVDDEKADSRDSSEKELSPVINRAPSFDDSESVTKPKLPLIWKVVMIVLTCLCTFGNHWSNGLIVALRNTIIKELGINNSKFSTLVSVTNLVNTFLVIILGYSIDKWGGEALSVVLSGCHLIGALLMAGSVTNGLDSYALLIVGKVFSAIGDGSLDNAQHRVFGTYFAPGRGFAFSIGFIWCVANLATFAGQSTANIISVNTGHFAWTLWVSAIIGLFSFLCAIALVYVDRYLRNTYDVTNHLSRTRHKGYNVGKRSAKFSLSAMRQLPVTFWFIAFFCAFENAGVQSFTAISTAYSQERLKAGAVIGGWVSSFYLLLPACMTPFMGIFLDLYGQRVTFLLISGIMFLISMLSLNFSKTVPAFITSYVFYAIAQAFTPAPQVEIIRNIIPNAEYFATAFAVKKSIVQGSIIIVTIASGKIQDDSPTNSLNNALGLWLAYAFICVAIAGVFYVLSFSKSILPAAYLAQAKPSRFIDTVEDIYAKVGPNDGAERTWLEKEVVLKSPVKNGPSRSLVRSVFPLLGFLIIVLGWIFFGLSIFWGLGSRGGTATD
ncbi:hypothetical protein D9758_011633 [Tetrapyrgos nigripes]|uniref:Lysosomal dipeptide transporter MFSD1 n=1 Tax=Tetrapyrgos nigripes TaxID=182062 RepID=A0A8H5CSE0_9AGAR|nr:hypothetical protein D9758_011633 [Tetrapyrgos nigripes]